MLPVTYVFLPYKKYKYVVSNARYRHTDYTKDTFQSVIDHVKT